MKSLINKLRHILLETLGWCCSHNVLEVSRVVSVSEPKKVALVLQFLASEDVGNRGPKRVRTCAL